MTGSKLYTYVRSQFPLQPAAGRTIHHVQGQSMSALGVSFINSTFVVAGLVYVAFSRVASYLGLYLEGFKPEFISVNQHVVDEMQRLRTIEKQVELAVVPIAMRTTNTSVSFCTHNVQSLVKYRANVAASCVGDCDVSALQQTRLRGSDPEEAGSLASHYSVRNDSTFGITPETRPARGSLLHTHKRLGLILDSVCGNTEEFELTAALMDTTKQLSRHTIAVNLYIASPATKTGMTDVVEGLTKALAHFAHFGDTAKDALIVVMGDFNSNGHAKETRSSPQTVLAEFLRSQGLHHASAHVTQTHDDGGAIDQVCLLENDRSTFCCTHVRTCIFSVNKFFMWAREMHKSKTLVS